MTENPHTNYRILVGKAELFGAAFYGHQGGKGTSAKLRRLWIRACKIAIEYGNKDIQMVGNRILN